MFGFLTRKPRLGIEITPSEVRAAAISGAGSNASIIFHKSLPIPDGIINDSFSSPSIGDSNALTSIIRVCLADCPKGIRRAALSLPDGLFRVQTLDFDELPQKPSDREKLIRWRLEKAAAFDISETILRTSVDPKPEKGFFVLACLAKELLIKAYENVLSGLGYETWAVGPSSFHIMNLYAPLLTTGGGISALAHVAGDTFTTVVRDGRGVKFYRFKEVKRGATDDVRVRLTREIDDSIHFYLHTVRMQQSAIMKLHLSVDAPVSHDFVNDLAGQMSLVVELRTPADVLTRHNGAGPEMAAAVGAGCSL